MQFPIFSFTESGGLSRTKSQHHSSSSPSSGGIGSRLHTFHNDSTSSPNFSHFLTHTPESTPSECHSGSEATTFGRKIRFSSFRIHNRNSPGLGFRRNTTRIHRAKPSGEIRNESKPNLAESKTKLTESSRSFNEEVAPSGERNLTISGIDASLSISNNRSAPQTPQTRTGPHRSISMNFQSHSNVHLNDLR